MNPILLAALINEIAIPELIVWLRSLHTTKTPLDDAAVMQKLLTDTQLGTQIGQAWLATHPPTP